MATQSKAASLWRHFTREELACRHCGEMHMDEAFMRRLVSMRKALAFPFPVTSGYRCPEHNAAVSGTGREGPHTTGRAVDIAVSHDRAFQLLAHAAAYGFTGVGVRQHGHTRFVHLDDLEPAPGRPRPTIWSYK